MKNYGIVTENRKVEKFIEVMIEKDLPYNIKRYGGSKTLSLIEIQGEDSIIPTIQEAVNRVAYHFNSTFTQIINGSGEV